MITQLISLTNGTRRTYAHERAKIVGNNDLVTLTYTDDLGDRVTRKFTQFGGCVREYRDGGAKQVCTGLRHMGNTLCETRDLLALIRYQWRVWRKDNK